MQGQPSRREQFDKSMGQEPLLDDSEEEREAKKPAKAKGQTRGRGRGGNQGGRGRGKGRAGKGKGGRGAKDVSKSKPGKGRGGRGRGRGAKCEVEEDAFTTPPRKACKSDPESGPKEAMPEQQKRKLEKPQQESEADAPPEDIHEPSLAKVSPSRAKSAPSRGKKASPKPKAKAKAKSKAKSTAAAKAKSKAKAKNKAAAKNDKATKPKPTKDHGPAGESNAPEKREKSFARRWRPEKTQAGIHWQSLRDTFNELVRGKVTSASKFEDMYYEACVTNLDRPSASVKSVCSCVYIHACRTSGGKP